MTTPTSIYEAAARLYSADPAAIAYLLRELAEAADETREIPDPTYRYAYSHGRVQQAIRNATLEVREPAEDDDAEETFAACGICSRDLPEGSTWPLCQPCDGAAREGGRLSLEAERYAKEMAR